MDCLLILDTTHPKDLSVNLQPVYATCSAQNINRLVVVISSDIQSANQLDDVLGYIYTNCRSHLEDYSKPIEVLIRHDIESLVSSSNYSLILAPRRMNLAGTTPYEITYADPAENKNDYTVDPFVWDYYKVSALGGTFDHLHDGHKILLSVAAFLTSTKLIIGVTDQELLANKKYKDHLQPFEKRVQSVLKFLQQIKPSVEYQVVPIRDITGPTGTVPEIEALIVSEETIAGAEIVNNARKEKHLQILEVFVVNVLGGGKDWKEKLSSTYIRELESSK